MSKKRTKPVAADNANTREVELVRGLIDNLNNLSLLVDRLGAVPGQPVRGELLLAVDRFAWSLSLWMRGRRGPRRVPRDRYNRLDGLVGG